MRFQLLGSLVSESNFLLKNLTITQSLNELRQQLSFLLFVQVLSLGKRLEASLRLLQLSLQLAYFLLLKRYPFVKYFALTANLSKLRLELLVILISMR